MKDGNINIDDLSVEQLEKILSKRREAQKNKKKEYEELRDKTVQQIAQKAEDLRKKMEETKAEMFVALNHFKLTSQDYGGVMHQDGKSMTLITSDQKTKLVWQVQESTYLDERAEQAAERLKTFLASMVKKQSKVAYEVINSLLEKKNGKYDHRLISRLFTYENEFNDPDWQESIRLFKEAIQKGGKSGYLRAYRRPNPEAAWVPIVLDFADIMNQM